MAQQIKKKYLQNDSVDGTKLKLLQGQSVRGEDSTGQEVDLVNLDESDKVLLKGEEAALKSQVDAEQSRAEGEETRIEGKLDQEVLDRESGDSALQSQIISLQGAEDILFEDNASVYADGAAAIEDPTGRDGWFFRSAGNSNKINWYFHDGQANPVTVGQFQSLHTIATVDSSSNDTFHLAYYTFPLGDGQDAGSWYRSRIVYVPSGNFERGVKTLFYMGQEPDASVYPDLPRVQMTVTTVAGSNAGLNEDSEVIMTAVLGTNSGAQEGTVRLLVNKLSFNSSVFSKEYSLEIRGEFTLAGIKQSLLEEAIERQSGDSALQANIDVEKARIDAILQASDADKDSFAEIVNLINSVDTENDSAFASYVLSNDAALAQEVSDREAADESLQQQIGDISSGLMNSLAQEVSDREAADITLQSNIDSEVNARESADMFLQTQISTEKSRIDAILDASDADKDSFAEIVNLINSVDTENDTAFAGYVSSNDARVSTLESEMDAVELSVTQETLAREAADQALQSQIDSLVQFTKEAIEVTAQMISDTYVDLQVEIKPNSMVMFVDRLGMHEGLDYSVSTVNGVSRITFLSPMLEPSEEAIEAGQFIRVTYAK